MSTEIPETYTRLVLDKRPEGLVTADTFKKETLKSEDLKASMGPTDVLVSVDYISLDPAMRGWLKNERSYVAPVEIGEVMRAAGLGTVVAVGSEVSDIKVGDSVSGAPGWTELAKIPAKSLQVIKAPQGGVPLDFMGVLGMTGLTAYFGLTDIGEIKAGETLVVSGAAGATGSVVCQIGKIVGAKVIAIAGSDDKCQWLEQEVGVDKALNYKSPDFVKDFKQSVGYLDVYFDNVGGEILDLCLSRLNKNARIVMCGAISAYNETKPRGLQNYLSLIGQRAKMQGFIVMDYGARFGEARQKLAEWLAAGKLKRRFHIEKGLEGAPQYLNHLFEGKNTGKLLVQVSSRDNSKL
jgi:hypothetical protein